MLLCFDKELKPVNPYDEMSSCKVMTVIWHFGKNLCAYLHLTLEVVIRSGNCSVYCQIVLKNPPLLFLETDMVCHKDYGELMIIWMDAVLINYGFGQLNWKPWSQPNPKNDSVFIPCAYTIIRRIGNALYWYLYLVCQKKYVTESVK